MKTLKVVLVAAMVSLSLMSMAQVVNKDRPRFESKYVPIATVNVGSELGMAIFGQVDGRTFLFSSEQGGYYATTVRLNGKIYHVRGTYQQWYRFFNPLSFEKANNSKRKIE